MNDEILQTPDIFSGNGTLRKAPALMRPTTTGVGHGMPELALAASKDALAVPYLFAMTQRHDNAEAMNNALMQHYNDAMLQGMTQDRDAERQATIAKLIGQLAPHGRYAPYVANGIEQVAPAMSANNAREDLQTMTQLHDVQMPIAQIMKDSASALNSGISAGYDMAPTVQNFWQQVTGDNAPFTRVLRSAEINAIGKENAARAGNTTNQAGAKSTTTSVYDHFGGKVPVQTIDERDAKSTTKGQGEGTLPDAPDTQSSTEPLPPDMQQNDLAIKHVRSAMKLQPSDQVRFTNGKLYVNARPVTDSQGHPVDLQRVLKSAGQQGM